MLLSEPLCPACVVDNAGVVLHRVGVLLWSLSLVLEAGTEPHRQGILREGPAAQKGTSTQVQYTSGDFQSNQKVHECSTTVHIWGFTVQSENTLVLNYNTQPGSFCPVTKYMRTQLQYTSGDFLSNQKVHEYSSTVHIRGVSVQSESAWVLNYSTHPGSFCPITKYTSTQLQYTSGEFLSNHKVHEYSTTVHIQGDPVQSESAGVLNYSTHLGIYSPITKYLSTQPQHTSGDFSPIRKYTSTQLEYTVVEFLSSHNVHENSTTVHIRGVSVQSQSTWVLNYSTHPGSFCPITKYMSTQVQYTSGEFLSNHKVQASKTGKPFSWRPHEDPSYHMGIPSPREQTDRQSGMTENITFSQIITPETQLALLTSVLRCCLLTFFIFTTIEITVYMLIASTYCWIFGAFHVWAKPVNGVFPKCVLANWVNWANLEKWSCVVEWPPVILVVVQPIGFLLQVCSINYYL